MNELSFNWIKLMFPSVTGAQSLKKYLQPEYVARTVSDFMSTIKGVMARPQDSVNGTGL